MLHEKVSFLISLESIANQCHLGFKVSMLIFFKKGKKVTILVTPPCLTICHVPHFLILHLFIENAPPILVKTPLLLDWIHPGNFEMETQNQNQKKIYGFGVDSAR